MRRLSLSLTTALAVLGLPAVPLAHAFLDHAAPPVGGIIAKVPAEVRLFFSEAIEPRFSGIELMAVDGDLVRAGPARVDTGDRRQLVLPLPTLPPGRYRVSWHVVSVDTHRTEGDFIFEIKP
jgi:methionine-rich copper-binding protein CopC